MKNIRIITVLICLGYVGLQGVDAQANMKEEKKVHKVQMLEVPDSVKKTLKSYSGYTISEDVSYKLSSSKRNADKIYRFKIQRKSFPYVLLVNEKGKVIGIETDEI